MSAQLAEQFPWRAVNADVEACSYSSIEEWHAIRRTGVGSSDAAAAAGISDYDGNTPLAKWEIKTGRAPEPDLSGDEAIRIGNALEPVTADFYSERTGRRLRRSNRVLRSRAHPFMLANLDRVVIGEDRLVEIKTVGFKSHGFISPKWGEDGSPFVPDDVWYQVQHQLGVTGARICDVAAFKAGVGLHIHPIERDDDAIAKLRILEARFWERVLTEDPPPATTVEEALRIYPQHTSASVEASEEIAADAARYFELSARVSADERVVKELRGRIAGFLCEADTLTVGGRPFLTYRTQTRAAHSVAESTFRVMRPVKEKN